MAVVVAKRPFTWGCEAVVVEFTSDYRVPEEALAEGFEYFLSVEDAHDLLAQMRGKRCSDRTRMEFVCHYATCDAYPAWFDDLADA